MCIYMYSLARIILLNTIERDIFNKIFKKSTFVIILINRQPYIKCN